VELLGLPLTTIVVMDGVDAGEDDMIIDTNVTVLGVLALPSEVVIVTTDCSMELGLVRTIGMVVVLCV